MMWFKTVALLSVVSAVIAISNDTNRESYVSYKKKYYGDLYKKLERNELETAARSEEYAGEALSGVYSECFAQISFSCLQKKVLNFINRMNRMEKFSLLGNYVSVVRTKNDYEPETEFQARLNTAEKESGLDDLMETAIDRFFNNHIIRFKIPNTFAILKNPENRNYQEESTALDFRFPYVDESESRKKKVGGGGGGGGGKMGKKMMMMMMMGLKAKFMMMGPMMMGMAGMMAMKSMMASMIALTISKIMLLKKFMMMRKGGNGGGDSGPWSSGGGNGGGGGPWSSGNGGGGGGGPWSSGGGGGGSGGWDRRNMQDRWDASNLAYRAYSAVENLF